MTLVAQGFASALYLFAAVLGWTGRNLGLGARSIPLIVALAAALHALGFYGLHLQTPPVPLSNFPAALSLIGWGTALGWLVARRWLGLRSAGPWVAAIAAAFTLSAELGLQLTAPARRSHARAPASGRTRTCCSARPASACSRSPAWRAWATSRRSAGSSAAPPVAAGPARAREPRPRGALHAGARLRAAHARRRDRLRVERESGSRSLEPPHALPAGGLGRVPRSRERARAAPAARAAGRRAAWSRASRSWPARYIGIHLIGSGT